MLERNEVIRIISVFSHFAASENPELDHFTRMQAEKLLTASTLIRQATGYSFIRHISNTSGIARFPEYQFEMVRPGIGIYGVGSVTGLDLKTVGRFVTRISQVKVIPGGEPVGYGCADVSDKERVIAILPVGYADGLNRKLGNRRGSLYIRNTRAAIVGNICMDMCMADITGIGAEEGDEAEIFGLNIKIDEIADLCGTIPYEVLTSVPGRVKRIFFRG
jgi:alanine racemase